MRDEQQKWQRLPTRPRLSLSEGQALSGLPAQPHVESPPQELRTGNFCLEDFMRSLTIAFALVILSATGPITAQEPVRQKQADREAVRSHCTSHFLAEQKLPAAPLAVIYQQGALARETCSCAADRITSNDRLSNTIGTFQWAPETDLIWTHTMRILGALLACA